eukprot:scaffold36288_cov110-Isochrysis_galbana.AAC.5
MKAWTRWSAAPVAASCGRPYRAPSARCADAGSEAQPCSPRAACPASRAPALHGWHRSEVCLERLRLAQPADCGV